MKNKLIDLNNHLFAELERLGDESLKGDALKEEVGRARAISTVAMQVVSNANLALRAEQLRFDGLIGKKPAMIEGPANG